jgi:SpoVK/Ycf46/Vps4 family AAA+-type ATPase
MKNDPGSLLFAGIPADVPEDVAALTRSRLARAFDELARCTAARQILLQVGTHLGSGQGGARAAHNGHQNASHDEATTEVRAQQYTATPPKFGFDQLVLPADEAEALMTAVNAIMLRSRIYGEWGLRKIEPSPSVALNLHGPPGTGKTLAAHAIAAHLGKPIIMAGYAELESKFHGDGPKNVKGAFHAAQTQDAVLFIDEADSLLSRRLTAVTQGSDQAINSMRSQIVLCLDAFDGVVIFSTNLVSNYDRAFESRVRNFHFTLPTPEARLAIWQQLLVPELPRERDVSLDQLTAETDGFSGREMRRAVIAAAERAALAGRPAICHADFAAAITQIKASRARLKADEDPPAASSRPASPEERAAIEASLKEQGILAAPADG